LPMTRATRSSGPACAPNDRTQATRNAAGARLIRGEPTPPGDCRLPNVAACS